MKEVKYREREREGKKRIVQTIFTVARTHFVWSAGMLGFYCRFSEDFHAIFFAFSFSSLLPCKLLHGDLVFAM